MSRRLFFEKIERGTLIYKHRLLIIAWCLFFSLNRNSIEMNNNKINLSNITVNHYVNGIQATINCNTTESATLEVIITDLKGRVQWQMKHLLSAGQTELVWKLPKLKTGQYNTWIQVKNQNFLRLIDILPAPKQQTSWRNLFGKMSASLVFIRNYTDNGVNYQK